MRIARLATISLIGFSVFSTGCIGCIDDEEANNGEPNATTNNNTNVVTAECQDTDIQGVIDDGDFDTDVVLCGEVTVEDDIRTTGGITITIRPGTVINMAVDKFMEIGWAGTEATLIAQGTAEDPIVFRGTTQAAGHWNQIILRESATSETVISNLIVRHAGVSGNSAILLQNTRAFEFTDVTVEDVGGAGVQADSFGDVSANLTVTGAATYPVIADTLQAVDTLPLGGDYTGNGEDFIQIAEGDYGGDVTFTDPGVPYLLDDPMRTTGTVAVTMTEGVEIHIAADEFIEFGWAGNEVDLTIAGTEADPVRFVGATPEAGHWDTIYIRDTVASSSSIDHIVVEHAGSGDRAGLTVGGSLTISNATFSNNAEADIRIGAEGLEADSANITSTRTDGPSAAINMNAAASLPTGGSYGSGDAYVLIEEGDFNTGGTIPAIDVPYRVADPIRTTGDMDLTIETGAEFVVESGEFIEFGWAGNEVNLTVDGVSFTGTDESPGHWRQVMIRDSVTSSSTFSNNTISHAGENDAAAVDLDNANITFSGNTIDNAAGVCIDRGSDMTDWASSNTLDCAGGDYNN